MVGASPAAESALVDAFLAYIFLFMSVVACGFAVSSVLRLRSEEEAGRAEAVLATPVSRTRWMAPTAVALGRGLLTVLMGLGLAVGYALGTGSGTRFSPRSEASWPTFPACWSLPAALSRSLA